MADGHSSDLAVRLAHVSKYYRLFRRPQDRLREFLSGGRRTYHTPFWALRDVTLELPRGGALGILGRNGAGKSTLLGIVAGVIQPTAGTLEVRGRGSAILGPGPGFNPRLIRRVCDRAVWLERGKVMAEGDVEGVVPEYETFCLSQAGSALSPGPAAGGMDASDAGQAALREKVARELRLVGTRWSVGNQRVRITRTRMLGADGTERAHFQRGEPVTIELDYAAEGTYPRAVFSVDIHRVDGVFVGAFNNYDITPCPLPVSPGSGRVRVRVPSLDLPGGGYALSFKAYTEPDDPFWTDPADFHHETLRFLVAAPRIQHGLLVLPGVWEPVP